MIVEDHSEEVTKRIETRRMSLQKDSVGLEMWKVGKGETGREWEAGRQEKQPVHRQSRGMPREVEVLRDGIEVRMGEWQLTRCGM